MTSKQENLLDWLRDAHAMEQQAEQMLKAQAGCAMPTPWSNRPSRC
ncbi:DUF892 family protein [Pseudomonas aeruginosa]|nr:DUF892 family protein [Pseudomonas aeruginosa]QIZ26266.1 DUF892 family protein [Pseudomonas aeruginosa]